MTALDLMKETAAKESAIWREHFSDEIDMSKSHPCPKVAERRGKVAALRAQGMTLAEIAEQLEVTLSTVKSDSAKAA